VAAKILFVDDRWKEEGWDEILRGRLPKTVEVLFEDRGYRALQRLRENPDVHLVVLDLRFEGQPKQGEAVFEEIRTHFPELPVIILTVLNEAPVAVRLIREGAYNYFLKSELDYDQFAREIENAIGYFTLRAEALRRTDAGLIIGESEAMRDVLRKVAQAAQRESPVLITGETGTGKELIARAIHLNSKRRAQPFWPVNCAAIPEELVESELFGHERGAFTGAAHPRRGAFEMADGGTLFLDEIGDLSVEVQAKLLRAIETGEIRRLGAERPRRVNVRIIAATNRNLEDLVRKGQFRQDLYYRLAVLRIHVPPLRERREDIPALVRYILVERLKSRKEVSDEAMALLRAYPWPGNIRELYNVLEQIEATVEANVVTPDHLAPLLSPPEIEKPNVVEQWVRRVLDRQAGWAELNQNFETRGEILRAILDGIIKRWIETKGERPRGKDLADLLGVGPNHLSQILHQAGIKLREYAPLARR
jgi:DNA-binding NtrC family response regulator